MSKEFEEFVKHQQKENGGYYPAKRMWDAAFAAGRALGRREVKGQTVNLLQCALDAYAENTVAGGPVNAICLPHMKVLEAIKSAIEAISE